MSRPFGYHHTEESKQKISLHNKGKTSWAKGKKLAPFSESTRKKMSESAKERKRGPLSEETKRKISLAQKGKPRFYCRKPLSEELKKYLSQKFKGRTLTEEWKRKISISLIGKMAGPKSSNWRGGISFEKYGPEFNVYLKEAIRERDGYRCLLCQQSWENNNLVIHHVDFNKLNNRPDNLATLCRPCHGKIGMNREMSFNYFPALINYSEENSLGKFV